MLAKRVARAAARHARRARVMRTSLEARCMLSTKRRGIVPSGIDSSNPFEIKFHVDEGAEEEIPTGSGIDGPESSFFDDEINRFHSEMIGVFGSEPEEHSGDGSQSQTPQSTATSSSDSYAVMNSIPKAAASFSTQERPRRQMEYQPPVYESRPQPPQTPTQSWTPTERRPETRLGAGASVMLIQGPCTYVHGGWVGSQDQWSSQELASIVGQLAHDQGLTIAQHHSNHEGQILDWLLSTSPEDKIILNWNGRLADSPTIFRALSSIRASVVVLTPLDVELGPLPSSVTGVITGFGLRSLELAIQACK